MHPGIRNLYCASVAFTLAMTLPAGRSLSAGPTASHIASQPCDGLKLDAYEIWKDVSSNEEAEHFLHTQYELHGSVVGFANWLRCQDFSVSFTRGPLGRLLREDDLLIYAGFAAAMMKRRPL